MNQDVLEGRHVAIATGAKPRKLNIEGEEHVTTSDQFLELESLPAKNSLHWRRLYLHGVCACLPPLGLTVHAHVARSEKTFDADLVVHGAGRVPDIEDLNLAEAKVETGLRGIEVNEYMQSVSNPAIYAAGDAAASEGPPLTPVAGYQGRIVAENLLKGNHVKAKYVAIPTVAFTIPPLASVGMSEDLARKKDMKFRTTREITSSWYSSRRVVEKCSGFKILIEEQSERILGAHLLGPHADEVINLFALAIAGNLPAARFRDTLFAYPTVASDVHYML